MSGTRLKRSWVGRDAKSTTWQRCALTIALAGALLGPADADDDVELARRLLKQGRILPLEQLLTRAQALRAGIPVEVELHAEDDSTAYVYEIEMLDREGTVWSIAFDAQTGQLIDLDTDED
ncbi:PepSY domain-containing protein [Halochromatium salexigens]|uniref:PepSY domain-containing protein n=1 Tax=Halochromatium salexigens TaxID=49447 RepID=UPI0019149C09|nr:PepSY domain-containing protein [Halochromatium salexigens]